MCVCCLFWWWELGAPRESHVGAKEKAKEQDFKDFKAYVDVPTMDDIERLIVRKKKETLLKQLGCGSSGLSAKTLQDDWRLLETALLVISLILFYCMAKERLL